MKDLGYARDYAYPHEDAEGAARLDYLPDALRGRRFFRPPPDTNDTNDT
jgi:putative ATPase